MPAAARKIALTDRSLQSLKPTGERSVIWDALLPGHAVRLSARGKRSFYAVKRRPGQPQPTWVLLGAYPELSLADSRAKAREMLGALAEGLDPETLAVAKRRAKEEVEAARHAFTFGAVAEEFIRRHALAKRSGRMIAGYIRRELVPICLDRGGDKPAPGTRRKAGGPYAARHALSAARKLFNWTVGRDVIAASPCDRIKAAELHGAPAARDRVLTDYELRAVWDAASATAYPYGPLVKTLMLSGQRRDEIAAAQWGEIDLDKGLLTIGADRMKARSYSPTDASCGRDPRDAAPLRRRGFRVLRPDGGEAILWLLESQSAA